MADDSFEKIMAGQTAMFDQTRAASAELAQVLGAFHKALRANGVPRSLAGHLTRDLLATMIGSKPS